MLHRSTHLLNPKIWAALNLILQILERKEQAVVFSPFRDPLDVMERFLAEAGIPAAMMDGRVPPRKRVAISQRFKNRMLPVVLCGTESCAEGHNWPLASNVILLAYSWAFDKLSQAIDRCHRLNSVKDLNYYAILCEGTTDRVLENNLNEKSDTSDLVLDGRLLDDNPREVSLGEILQTAVSEFDGGRRTIDEAALALEWPALRESLRRTYSSWRDETSPFTTQAVAVPIPEPGLISTNIIPLPPPAVPRPAHPWREQLQRRLAMSLAPS